MPKQKLPEGWELFDKEEKGVGGVKVNKSYGERVLRNFEKVLSKKNSEFIGKDLYQALNLHCGFIAHYDIHGFRARYNDLRELVDWLTSDKNVSVSSRIGLKDEVSEIVNGLLNATEKYGNEVEDYFAEKQKVEEIGLAKRIAKKYGLVIDGNAFR